MPATGTNTGYGFGGRLTADEFLAATHGIDEYEAALRHTSATQPIPDPWGASTLAEELAAIRDLDTEAQL